MENYSDHLNSNTTEAKQPPPNNWSNLMSLDKALWTIKDQI